MKNHRFPRLVGLLVSAAITLLWAVNRGLAETQTAEQPSQHDSTAIIERMMNRVTHADREAAAARAAARAGVAPQSKQVSAIGAPTTGAMTMTMPNPGGVPHYFGPYPNWAFSPPLRKFVDSLPGLGAANINNLGQYLPVAIADTNTYPGSDYYEIGLVEYTEQMHSDLPPTTEHFSSVS